MTDQILPSATRRTVLAAVSSAALAPANTRNAAASEAATNPQAGLAATRININGIDHETATDPRVTLLDLLREHLSLTGTKKGCDHGQCGACTVHIDGHSALACLTLAAALDGRRVTTIEGLEHDGGLHPVQQAFIDHDAFQCGYCTPGQIMSAVSCINGGHATSSAAIRESMSGNLCRCAAYPNITAAIIDAKSKMGA